MSRIDFIKGLSLGKPTAKFATVPASTGPIYTVTHTLDPNSAITLTTGSNSNLTVSNSVISSTVAIASSVSQIAVVREAFGTLAIEYPVTLTGQSVPATIPTAPTLGTPVAGNGMLTIPWTDGYNGGSTITARYVKLGTSSGGEANTLYPVTLTGGNIQVTGVVNGTIYYVLGYTQNSIGYSQASNEVNGTPVAPASASLDFSQATNSQYVAAIF